MFSLSLSLSFNSIGDLNQFLNDAGKLCDSDTKGYFKIKGNNPPKVIAYKSYDELGLFEIVYQYPRMGSAIRKGRCNLFSSDRKVIDLTDSITKLDQKGASFARLINQKMKAPLFLVPSMETGEDELAIMSSQPPVILINRQESVVTHIPQRAMLFKELSNPALIFESISTHFDHKKCTLKHMTYSL